MKKKKVLNRYKTPKGAPDLRLLKFRLLIAIKNYTDYDDEDAHADRVLLEIFKRHKQYITEVKAGIKWVFNYLLKESPNPEIRTAIRVTRAKKHASEIAKKVWGTK